MIITDTFGRLLIDVSDEHEPEPGSVIVVRGANGTAWQRFASDGLWHPANARMGIEWREMVQTCIAERNASLVYDAPGLPNRGSRCAPVFATDDLYDDPWG